MSQSNQFIILDLATHLLVVARGENLPIVVGIIVRVASNLLTLAGNTAIVVTQGILVGMAVQERLGLLMFDRDGVVVLNIDRIRQHGIVTQCFLKFGRHEIIPGAGARQYGKVDLEPEQIKQEWKNNEADSTSSKVPSKLRKADGASRALDVQQIPEINDNRGTNGDEGEGTDILGGHVARQGKAGQDEPFPPLATERLVAKLVKLDVEEQTACHSQDQSSIKKNQSSLANVGVVK